MAYLPSPAASCLDSLIARRGLLAYTSPDLAKNVLRPLRLATNVVGKTMFWVHAQVSLFKYGRFALQEGLRGLGVPVGSIWTEFQLKRSHGDPFRDQNHVFVWPVKS